MTDSVIRALREIVPVTRGQLNLGGRTSSRTAAVMRSRWTGRP